MMVRLRMLADAALRGLLRLWPRPKRSSGVLLVSARGPAEMVFLAAALPRFLRLAKEGEKVTLLLRADAYGMNFLFPRGLTLKRVDFRRMAASLSYRWQRFRELHGAHYRLVVSLDVLRDPILDEALIAAARARHTAAMEAPRHKASRLVFDRVLDCGPVHQDKILRWSRFADFLTGFRHPPSLALMPAQSLPERMRFEMPTVVVFPFSAVRERQLPAEQWRLILGALPHGWHIRVAGHQQDFDRNPEFALLLKLPHLTVDTSGFDHLASVLRGARLVLGADTAGVHLSIVLGVPTLCLASAAYVDAGVPYAEAIQPANAHFLYQPMDCQGCLGRCRLPLQDGMFPCVAALDAQRITTTIDDLIARGGY